MIDIGELLEECANACKFGLSLLVWLFYEWFSIGRLFLDKFFSILGVGFQDWRLGFGVGLCLNVLWPELVNASGWSVGSGASRLIFLY